MKATKKQYDCKRLTVQVWIRGRDRFKLFAYVRATTGDRYIRLGFLLIGWWFNYYLNGKDIKPITPL